MSVEATLSLAAAVSHSWQAVVVGAGPAGSFLALNLARAGIEVLLIDRATFPRWKVCGCCLNGAALSILDSAGLGGLVASAGAVPLSRVHLAAGRSSADLALPKGAALSREVFDAALLQAAIAAGVAFLSSTARLLPRDDSQYRRLRLRQGGVEGTIAAQVLIVADGLGGQVLAAEPGHQVEAVAGSRIGAGTVAESGPDWFQPGTIYMACGAGGYVGLVRLEDGRLDLAAALDPGLVRQEGGPAGAAAAILEQTGWPDLHVLRDLSWRGTPALSRQTITPGGERYFVVGDAAGYVEPFTGEGMAWALASSAVLTPFVVRAIQRWDRILVRQWRFRLRQLLGRRRLVCRLVTQLLRQPILTRALVRLLHWLPSIARPVIVELNRPMRGAFTRFSGGNEKKLPCV
jgi:menaquinone-9 beta-reductase